MVSVEGVFIITFVYLSEFHSIIVAAYNGEHTTGPSFDVIVGNSPAVIRDRIIVSQPLGLKGDINLIHSELSKLSNIGIVTVSAEKETPDAYNQCSWKITFESKAGDVPSLQVAANQTVYATAVWTMSSRAYHCQVGAPGQDRVTARLVA